MKILLTFLHSRVDQVIRALLSMVDRLYYRQTFSLYVWCSFLLFFSFNLCTYFLQIVLYLSLVFLQTKLNISSCTYLYRIGGTLSYNVGIHFSFNIGIHFSFNIIDRILSLITGVKFFILFVILVCF